jgi:hypothetical protein
MSRTIDPVEQAKACAAREGADARVGSKSRGECLDLDDSGRQNRQRGLVREARRALEAAGPSE